MTPKKKRKQHKTPFEIKLNHEPNYPEYISITGSDDMGLTIWTSQDAFSIAYKLMSLASEMK